MECLSLMVEKVGLIITKLLKNLLESCSPRGYEKMMMVLNGEGTLENTRKRSAEVTKKEMSQVLFKE